MDNRKLALSFCIGEFYLIGKVSPDNLQIGKVNNEYAISFVIPEEDVKRIDDIDLENTRVGSKSNVLQIDFNTGERKWI
jgi:hypothetical protein